MTVRVLAFIFRLLFLPIRLVAGYDVFISYSRADRQGYVEALAAAVSRRTAPRYDIQETETGASIPLMIYLAIISSRVLVVIATSNAIRSPHVMSEIRIYRLFGGRSIQVVAPEALAIAGIAALSGRPVAEEASLRPDGDGLPSPAVITRIVNAVGFWKRSRRQAFMTVIAVALLWAASYFAQQQSLAALESQRAAETARLQRVNAEATLATTTHDLSTRTQQLGETQAAADRAQRDLEVSKAAVAAAGTRLAQETQQLEKTTGELNARQADVITANRALEDQRRVTKEARDAQETADRSRVRAIRDALSAGASRVRDALRNLELLKPAVTDLLVSFLGWPSGQGDPPDAMSVALADAIMQQQARGMALGAGDFPQVDDFAVSTTSHLLVTTGQTRAPKAGSETYATTLWDLRTREPIGDLDAGTVKAHSVAISPDARTVAIGYETGNIQILSIGRSQAPQRPAVKLSAPGAFVRFTATGKQLLVWAGKEWTGTNVTIVDVETGVPTPLSFSRQSEAAFAIGRKNTDLSMQNAPSFFGVLEGDAALAIVDVETHSRQPFSLRDKAIHDRTGNIDNPLLDAVSPDGRWVLLRPFVVDERRPRLFLLDLRCVARPTAGCAAAYPLPVESEATFDLKSAFSPDAHYLLVGDSGTLLAVYDLTRFDRAATSARRFVDIGEPFRIASFGTTAATVQLVVGSVPAQDYEVRTYDLVSQRLLMRDPCELPTACDTGPDVVAAADNDAYQVGKAGRRLLVWGRQPLPGLSFLEGLSPTKVPLGPALDAALAPDGTLVATSHASGQVALWRVADQALDGV